MKDSASIPTASSREEQIYRKISVRILPILVVCYLLAYIDRFNVGFAQITMGKDLGFSTTVFGIGGGIFFLGYMLFEVPSNYLLERIGARRTLVRITFLWGTVSAATMFVSTPAQFYVMRLVLGIAEAGFFPGVILYLTYWYPVHRRAKIVAAFMTPIAISGLVGGPLSGLIMQTMDGVYGWQSWQWLFLIEGLPSVLMACVVGAFLVDRPADATWLSDDEKRFVLDAVSASGSGSRSRFGDSLRALLTDGKVYAFIFVYFAMACGLVTTSIWIPTLLKGTMPGATPMTIGLLAAIPYALGGIGMVAIGRHSDQVSERRWHCTLSMIAAALGMALLAWNVTSLAAAVAAMSLTLAGIFSGYPTFWAAVTAQLGQDKAAAGIALINSLSLVGGLVTPAVTGIIHTHTGSFALSLYLVGTVMLIGAFVFKRAAGRVNEYQMVEAEPLA